MLTSITLSFSFKSCLFILCLSRPPFPFSFILSFPFFLRTVEYVYEGKGVFKDFRIHFFILFSQQVDEYSSWYYSSCLYKIWHHYYIVSPIMFVWVNRDNHIIYTWHQGTSNLPWQYVQIVYKSKITLSIYRNEITLL